MKDSMIIEGREYISSRRGAEITRYSNDYIGQLCRAGKIKARMIGRTWFVERESLFSYKKSAETFHKSNGKPLTSHLYKDVASLASLRNTDVLKPAVTPKVREQALPPNVPTAPAVALIPSIVWKITYAPGVRLSPPSPKKSIPEGPKILYSSDVRPLLPELKKYVSQNNIPSPLRKNLLSPYLPSLAAVAVVLCAMTLGTFAMTHPGKIVDSFARSVQGVAQQLAEGGNKIEQTAAALQGASSAISSWWSHLGSGLVSIGQAVLGISPGRSLVLLTAPAKPPSLSVQHSTTTIVQRIVSQPKTTFITSLDPSVLDRISNLEYQFSIFSTLKLPQSDSFARDVSLALRGIASTNVTNVTSGGGSGSVTSIDASGGTTGLSFSGGPVTSSGTLTLAGTLNVVNGGTGTSTAPSYGKVLLGNSSGGYDLIATSSLGITASGSGTVNPGSINQLAYYAANGTTVSGIATSSLGLLTTNVAEGTNLYYTLNRFASALAGTTTDALAQGTTNKYYSTNLFAASLAGTTTDALTQGSVNKYYSDLLVNSYINASTTIPKTYSTNTFTAGNTFNGGLTIGTLNGPLQANAGVVSATTSVGVTYGGTGLTTAPSYGQLLVGNASSGYTLTATSSLNLSIPLASTTGTLTVANGGTGATTFGQGWIYSNGGTGALNSSTSPTVNYITATSTTATSTFAAGLQTTYLNVTGTSATSTFARGIDLAGGCFSINGTCLGNGSGSVTSVNASGGTTGLSFAGGPITTSGTLTLSGTLIAANGGTGISSPSAAGILLGSYAGGGWQQLATSSLGLLTTNVAEGSNLYYTLNRFASALAGTTTDALAQGLTNKYYSDALVNAYIHASTTIPKTYSTNTFTAGNTFNGGLTVGSLNGPLQANNGVVSATTSVGVLYGGTGLTTAPSYGQLLVGNASSGYTLTSTSSLNLSIPLASTTGTLAVSNGGTGATSFGQGWIFSSGGTTALNSSTSPTVNYITATSTTATSTFAGPLSINSGINNSDSVQSGIKYLRSLNALRIGISDSGGTGATGDYWSIANVGLNSATFGRNNTASGDNSFAVGLGSYALGLGSFAGGNGNNDDNKNIASGIASFAFGNEAQATNYAAVAIGHTAKASGDVSIALGSEVFAEGDHSVAIGFSNTSSLTNDIALGNDNNISGSNSIAIGSSVTVSGSNSIAIGESMSLNRSGEILLQNADGNFLGLGASNGAVAIGDDSDNLLTLSGIHTNGVELTSSGGNFLFNGGNPFIFTGANLGIATTSPWRTFSVNGSSDLGTNALAGYFTGTTTATSTLAGGLQALYLNITGTSATSTFARGIDLAGGCYSINGSCLNNGAGSVTSIATNNGLTGGTITTSGTIGLNVAGLVSNGLVTWNGSNLVATGTVNLTAGYFTATTSTASVFPYASTTALTVSGTNGLTLGTLNGPLQANNGVVSATTSVGVVYGGTGLTTAPSYGQLLVGNASSGYTLTSTSSLNLSIPLASTTGTLAVANGGTGATSFGQGWLFSSGGTTALNSSTSPTVNYIVSTSTTATSTFAAGIQTTYLNVTGTSATSTFARGIDLAGGCFSISGSCLNNGAGSVTSVNASGGTTGLSFAGGPITTSGTLTLSGTLIAANGGTGISSPSAAGIFLGSYAGGGWQQLATSSLGLLTTNVAEGSNLYYTLNRFASALAGTTTDALAQGTTNKYYSTNLFAASLAGTTTDALAQGAVNKYYSDLLVNSYINASSTIPKTYSTNTFTAGNTFNGGLTIGSLNGPLQANAGVVSATTSVGVVYGGTGLTTAPSYGQLLVGNASSGYTLTATSSLGLAFSSFSGTLGVSQGGTGATTFGQGWLYSSGGTTALNSSTSPTVNYIVATSTTATSTFAAGLQTTYLNVTGTSATSTFARGIDLAGGCYSIGGTCLGNGSGSVSSIATNNGLTGGTITTSGTIGLNTAGLSTNALVTWNGSNLVATATPNLTAGYFTATTSTASTFPYASSTALTVSGINGLKLGSLNGPLQANNGVVSATTSVGVIYGGTGLTTAPSYGQLLVGNASSGYTLTATSSLGLAFSSLSGTLGVSQGGTGATSFGQGWIYSNGGTTALSASTSPTVNYIVATSTTATSTFSKLTATNLAVSSLTSGRIPYSGGGGYLLDTGNLAWDNSQQILTVTGNSTTFAPSAPSDNASAINYGPGSVYSNQGWSHSIKIYPYKTIGSTRVYSANSLLISLSDDGGDSDNYQINWAWTAVTGADGYRLLKTDTYHPYAYDYYHDVATNSFTENGDEWTAGNTITPFGHVPALIVNGGESVLNEITAEAFYTSTGGKLSPVGGEDTQVQYNSSGDLSGSSQFTWTGDRLNIIGGITLHDNGTDPDGYAFRFERAGFAGIGMGAGYSPPMAIIDSYDDAYAGVPGGGHPRSLVINPNGGRVFIGAATGAPSAELHLHAGSTTAGYAPLKITSGPLLTTAEAGTLEFLTDKIYWGITTGPARKEITLNDIALTSGRVPYNTTNGRLTDTSTFVFTGTNLGVGTTTPWKVFSVNGAVSLAGLTTNSAAQSSALCLSSTNEVVADTNGSGCLVSSARFKQNITSLDQASALQEIMKLNPVSFYYTPSFNGALQSNPNFNGQQVGFIAEEVTKIDPRLVTLESDGVTPHGVRYENITAILAKAIQEQQGQIGTLASTTGIMMSSMSSTATTTASNLNVLNSNYQLLTENLASSTQSLASLSSAVDTTNQTFNSNFQSVASSIQSLNARLDTLASSTQATSTLSSLILTQLASSTAGLASSTADILASSTPSFIGRIANAVKDLIQSAGEWIVSTIHATLAVFNRVETQTAAVSNGIEMTDQVTGDIYCVTMRNGKLDQVAGACSTATSTPAGLSIQKPAGPNPLPPVLNTATSTPPALSSTSTPDIASSSVPTVSTPTTASTAPIATSTPPAESAPASSPAPTPTPPPPEPSIPVTPPVEPVTASAPPAASDPAAAPAGNTTVAPTDNPVP